MLVGRRLCTLAFVLALAAPAVTAQEPGTSSSQQTSGTSTQKKKKVWTEEDLRKLKGGVNVVGEPAAANPKKDDKQAAEKADAGSGILADREEEAPAAEPEKPPCKSWSWAAAVETVLAPQGVSFGQIFWLSKSYGGEVCTQELGSISSLARRVEGDYTLDDGTRIRIEARTFANFPDGAAIVTSQEKGLPYIVAWKRHPYVAAGYTGVKLVDSESGVVAGYSLDTVDLVDPYEGRQVTFDRAKDNLADIQGLVQFVVTPR